MAKPASAEQKAATADQRRMEQALEREKAARAKANLAGLWSRRDVFGRFGWAIFGAFSGITLLAAVRSAFPRVLFQPPTSFKAGLPTDFTIGEVSTKFQKDQRVWIVREAEGIYAIFAKCTHLGCTPRWLVAENKFKCPCHGSGYDSEGVNFEGPAPRPMDRAHVDIDPTGKIIVDTSRLYMDDPRAGVNQFNDQGAYLPV
jgi:cytochrome b6-f complex iron-sulfur subunit